SILSSADRRSGESWGWPAAAADPASAVVVFMPQGCRPRRPPSIGITPVRTLVASPKTSGSSPMPWGCRRGLADATGQPARWVVARGSGLVMVHLRGSGRVAMRVYCFGTPGRVWLASGQRELWPQRADYLGDVECGFGDLVGVVDGAG